MFHDPQQMIRLVLLGVATYVCVHELWVYRFRAHDGEHVFVAMWAVLVGGFVGARLVHMSGASPTTTLWAIRVQFAFGFAVVPHSLWMIRAFLGLPRSPPFLVAFVGTLLPIVAMLLPDVGFGSELVVRTPIAGPEVVGLEPRAGFMLSFVLTPVALAYFGWSFRHARPHAAVPEHTYVERRWIVLIGLGTVVPAAASDILLFTGWGPGIPVLDYAFTAFVFAVSFVLTRRALLDMEALERWAEQRAREAQARQAQLWATDRLASLGTLAAGVAHEINNPLTYVTANLELIDEHLVEIDPTDEQKPVIAESRELIAEAQRGAFAVRDIVGDLRVFSRAEKRAREPTDVRECVVGAIKMASNEIRHRAELVQELEATPLVDADPGELTQVLLNLLVNAAHAIPESSLGSIQVRTGVDEMGRVVASVADSGEGIPPEVRERIFDPFFTTKPTGVGTGLGLSICHGIVTGLGGVLEVASEVGEGSTFTLRLPPTEATAAVKAPRRDSTGKHALDETRGQRVLVVDDERLVARALKRMLRGYEVEVVNDGAEAIRRAVDGSFEVIVCDLMMPGVGGVDVYEALQAANLEDRVVFVTGGAFTPRAMKFLETVDAPRIVKPIDPDELRRTVRQIVRRRRARLLAADAP